MADHEPKFPLGPRPASMTPAGGFEIGPPTDGTTVLEAAERDWDLLLRCDGCDRCDRWTARQLSQRARRDA
jgi:hypothetical protein